MPRWYKQLSSWSSTYGEKVQFLLFPSDEFNQELPTDEIVPFLEGFKITKDLKLSGGGVELMDKVTVNGDSAEPVFELGKEAFPGDIAWNFAGIFVFDGEGKCVNRFDSKQLKEVDAAIAALA